MATLSQPLSLPRFAPTLSWAGRYNKFLTEAEFVRFGWTTTVLMIQGCILTPALLFSMFLFQGGDWQFLVGNLSFLLVLVPILSALPVKYLFPAFGLSVLIHLSIILLNVL